MAERANLSLPACNARTGATPGDPQECRQHALTCTQLAEEALTPNAKQTFLHLSDTWTKLAAELEAAQAFVSAMNGVKFDRPETGSPLMVLILADPLMAAR